MLNLCQSGLSIINDETFSFPGHLFPTNSLVIIQNIYFPRVLH